VVVAQAVAMIMLNLFRGWTQPIHVGFVSEQICGPYFVVIL
jgi:hypothetical protein